MFKVLIALDGSADARIVDLAGALLAGREIEVTLLHVMPVLVTDDQGWDGAVVLEGYVAAERCGVEMAPLVDRLHAGFAHTCQSQEPEPRLVPRHLIHHDDVSEMVEQCGIARQRQDALALLAASARRLRQHGIDATRVTRDSAIGNPVDIIPATAAHLGADLVIVGSHSSGWTQAGSSAPCPVLVVPATDDADSGEGTQSRAAAFPHCSGSVLSPGV